MTEPLDHPDVYGERPEPMVDDSKDTSAEEYWREVGNYGKDCSK